MLRRAVIRSFRHTGLERFFRTGSKAGIQPKHAARLRLQLTAIELSSHPQDMNRPGWDWHPLKGAFIGQYAVTVNGNWRVTFAFEGTDAVLVEHQDYH